VQPNPTSLPEPRPEPSARSSFLVMQRAKSEDAAAWDQFVNEHPEGRYSHLWGYRTALEKAYGYRCVYRTFLSEGNLCGIFPSIRRPRHGGWLISQPFNEYGGPLTRGLTAEHYSELTRLLLNSAREERCGAIEIRGGIGCEELAHAGGWIKQPLHSYALLNLEEPERLWRKALTNEARKGVNKARKSGLSAEIRRGAAAVQDPFFDLYLDSMKRLGVPPHSQAFFEHLAAGIGERLVAAWVVKQSRAAAILLGATTGRRVHIFVIASDPQAWSLRPSDLAHWELISWACQEGLQVFDFGSARYQGQIQFKKKWGVSLYDYSFYLIAAPQARARLKIQTVKSSSRTMSAMSTLWRQLMPLPLTRVMGPAIRKYLTK
jgi:CelD/BcsL family acetyltransferase involved in cellulose biosynthesis